MSSEGRKKPSSALSRRIWSFAAPKITSGSPIRFIRFGAVVPAISSAGFIVAFTRRCMAPTGIENSDPACHSKACRAPPSSSQTSVVPRPSTTRKISS